jgi:hypothetical protein
MSLRNGIDVPFSPSTDEVGAGATPVVDRTGIAGATRSSATPALRMDRLLAANIRVESNGCAA